jgi:hypothetical protein
MHLKEKQKFGTEQELDVLVQTAVKCNIVMMTRYPTIGSINDDSTTRVDDIW